MFYAHNFFLIRGLVENSYGLFSIDFLLFTTSIFIIEIYLTNQLKIQFDR